jgi:hypothetical protein
MSLECPPATAGVARRVAMAIDAARIIRSVSVNAVLKQCPKRCDTADICDRYVFGSGLDDLIFKGFVLDPEACGAKHGRFCVSITFT